MSDFVELDDGSLVVFCDENGAPVDQSRCAYAVMTRPDGYRVVLVPDRQEPVR